MTTITNPYAWAVGTLEAEKPKYRVRRFHVRRIFWGRLLAREEKREGEVIRKVFIQPAETVKRSR